MRSASVAGAKPPDRRARATMWNHGAARQTTACLHHTHGREFGRRHSVGGGSILSQRKRVKAHGCVHGCDESDRAFSCGAPSHRERERRERESESAETGDLRTVCFHDVEPKGPSRIGAAECIVHPVNQQWHAQPMAVRKALRQLGPLRQRLWRVAVGERRAERPFVACVGLNECRWMDESKEWSERAVRLGWDRERFPTPSCANLNWLCAV